MNHGPRHPSLEDGRLDRAFLALADPVRRAIVARLEPGSATLGELAEPFAITLQAVSRHISVLEDCRARVAHAARRSASRSTWTPRRSSTSPPGSTATGSKPKRPIAGWTRCSRHPAEHPPAVRRHPPPAAPSGPIHEGERT